MGPIYQKIAPLLRRRVNIIGGGGLNIEREKGGMRKKKEEGEQ
jgi:hypothetical protein